MAVKKTLILVAIALLGLANTAHAWNGQGHEQVADIAWKQLNAKAKKVVAQILMAGDPQFRPASDKEEDVRSAFRKAATFADYIKGNTYPNYKETLYEKRIDQENLKWHPDTDEEVSPGEKTRCKTWHYFDTPIRYKGDKPKAPGSNALLALGEARDRLAELEKQMSADRQSECWYLYWIEHVTGDLHQPLHCVSSFEFDPKGDAGGNRFRTGISDSQRPERTVNLHSYWDSGISHAVEKDVKQGLPGDMEAVTDRWSADSALKPSEADADNLDIASWIKNGAELADSKVYTGIEREGKASADYENAHIELSKKQAVLAGTRLARLLNKILGS